MRDIRATSALIIILLINNKNGKRINRMEKRKVHSNG